MTIRSRVPSETYKQEWERIFGQKKQSGVDEQGNQSDAGEASTGNQEVGEIQEAHGGCTSCSCEG